MLDLVQSQRGDFLSRTSSVLLARAPARLDVMGGIADYSGSLVLEGTLSRAAHVAVQRRRDNRLRAMTVGVADLQHVVEFSLEEFRTGNRLKSYSQIQRLFSTPQTRWAGYVLGGLHVLQQQKIVSGLPHGLNLLLSSDIPMGAGVASSAAIEVAAMRAICALYGLELDGLTLARLCQMVENRVVGAPCGIMDQVTSAVGQPRELLALLCRPCEVIGHYAVPRGYRFIGINSGVKHSVGGLAYGRVRAAAFMGLKIIAAAGAATSGHWCNVAPSDFAAEYEALLPDEMSGADFLKRYQKTGDTVTSVLPDLSYPVRQASRHPVYENARVHRFAELLTCGDEAAMIQAGKLMVESHESYSACGLGAPETDLLVRLVQECGPSAGLYGAKITGGGSGGTVAILAAQGTAAAIRGITAEYRRQTGLKPTVLTGSAEGAMHWGVKSL
ncbi:MAG: GHMP kinase [Armatimonadia bacterium]